MAGSWQRRFGDDLVSKIRRCGEEVGHWGKSICARFSYNINRCKRRIEELMGKYDDHSILELRRVKSDLNFLLVQEKKYWRQHAKTHWMRDGDSNTRFVHVSTSTRKQKNELKNLKNAEGVVVTSQVGISHLARDYFNDLFCEQQPKVGQVVNLITPRNEQADNLILMAPFSDEELRVAAFHMHQDKAPGS